MSQMEPLSPPSPPPADPAEQAVRGILDRIADFETEGAEKIREWFGDRLLPCLRAVGVEWRLAHNLGVVLLRRGWIPPRGPLGDRPELVEYFLWWVIKEICDPLVGLSPGTPWHIQILAALVGSETLLSSLAEAMGAPGWNGQWVWVLWKVRLASRPIRGEREGFRPLLEALEMARSTSHPIRWKRQGRVPLWWKRQVWWKGEEFPLLLHALEMARLALRPIQGKGEEFPLLLDVLEMARLGGWQVVILNWPSGTPDLVLLRGPEVLAVELKSGRGRPKERQREILARLAAAGLEVHLWRPQDRSAASARLRGRDSNEQDKEASCAT
jgi:hypothetical protein